MELRLRAPKSRIGGRKAAILLGLVAVVAVVVTGLGVQGPAASASTPTPIQHVIIMLQENHSFDNVLGLTCMVRPTPCDGTNVGTIHTGQVIRLAKSPDVVPAVLHTNIAQSVAINNGKMNEFDLLKGCRARDRVKCYSQYSPAQIPNVAALADTFAVSDRTFETDPVPSFGAHVELATGGTLDGFWGINPSVGGNSWGCDGGHTTIWRPNSSSPWEYAPACVPAPKGSPEFALQPPAVRTSPVPWVPTIMDQVQQAGESWRIYAAPRTDYSHIWAICPTFADCRYTAQYNNEVETNRILTDAANGTLPNFSFLLPAGGVTSSTSQHNGTSMTQGDDWIGKVVSALENGPEWSSTALLLTWDDCGCFYDHVPPPAGTTFGIRVPMVLISPWAKPGYTDSNVASLASSIAFAESVLGLPPLTSVDAAAYNYMGSFDFTQTPHLAKVNMVDVPVPPSSVVEMHKHPPDPSDPT